MNMLATKLSQQPRPPVGVSSCLLGDRVRYDGGHKADAYIIDTLGECFDLRPFCPEVAIGLGVPRKPIKLVRQTAAVDSPVRCVEVDDPDKDYTEALTDCADSQLPVQRRLCGYILKKDSPSCGMARVRVWSGDGSERSGIGIYARRLMENLPWLPVVEEGSLADPAQREDFIQRVFALYRNGIQQ